eukprot:GGOE01001681.1.p1 GENE.GGOE01001681.1~~GGOE01001681.1.p1  ORF type:complete len:434 (+),score=77.20 GGOE01001681.1:72-1373(+)
MATTPRITRQTARLNEERAAATPPRERCRPDVLLRASHATVAAPPPHCGSQQAGRGLRSTQTKPPPLPVIFRFATSAIPAGPHQQATVTPAASSSQSRSTLKRIRLRSSHPPSCGGGPSPSPLPTRSSTREPCAPLGPFWAPLPLRCRESGDGHPSKRRRQDDVPPTVVSTRRSDADNQLQNLLAMLRSGDVLALVGAGISTSAGLPDFRSANGIFPALKRKFPLLARPEDVFHIKCFYDNPKPFLEACHLLMNAECAPTPTHYLLRELDRQGMLYRVYTQNVDGLEFKAHIPRDKVVQMHGSFERAHCTECHTEVSAKLVRRDLAVGVLSPCTVPGCGGAVKPDIVLYGEDLPARVQALAEADFERCSVLLVMGTSLNADPAKKMVNSVSEGVRRVFLNREKLSSKRSGDVVITGECDALAEALLRLLQADN